MVVILLGVDPGKLTKTSASPKTDIGSPDAVEREIPGAGLTVTFFILLMVLLEIKDNEQPVSKRDKASTETPPSLFELTSMTSLLRPGLSV